MNRSVVPDGDWQPPLPPPPDGSPVPEPVPLASLGEMAATVGRRWRGLAAWVALCLAVAGWYLRVTPPEYTATATVILEPRRQTVPTQDGTSANYPPTLDSAQAESQIQVIKSERILTLVFDQLDLRHAPEFAPSGPGLLDRALTAARLKTEVDGAVARLRALAGLDDRAGIDPADAETAARTKAFQAFSDRVAVRRIGQSYVLEVAYRALSPDAASRIANAVTSAYILAQVDLKAAAAHNGAEYLQERVVDIKAEQDAALDGVRRGLIPAIQFPDADARIIGAALRPLGKSSPKVALVLVFALSFGALTGLLAVAIGHGLDRTLSTRAQVWHALGLDCLGVLPDVAGRRSMRAGRRGALLNQDVVRDPESHFSHAVRGIRTAILLSQPPGKRHAVGFVSWSHGEGRTTLASNLAHLLSVSGSPVTLVDGDLRNPVLTVQLAPDATVGLSEALVDRAALARLKGVVLTGTLQIVPAVAAGRASGPNVFLGSPETQALLADSWADRDVVVDLPPLSTSSDAQALSPFLDGVVLVVEAGRTSLDDALGALRAMRGAKARVLGVVLNRAKPTGAGRKPRPRVAHGRMPAAASEAPSDQSVPAYDAT